LWICGKGQISLTCPLLKDVNKDVDKESILSTFPQGTLLYTCYLQLINKLL